MRTIIFAVILNFLLPSAAIQAAHQEAISPPKVSLDLLVSRVDAYWKLLLEGKKPAAAEYVYPPDRERFLNLSFEPFSKPQLKSLELSADRTEAKVTVTVTRALPVGLIDWQLTEKWVFDSSNWYLDFDFASKLMSGEGQQPQKSDLVKKREAAESELRSIVRFEQTALNFGRVRQGAMVSLNLKYFLDGKEPLEIGIRKSAPGVRIQGLRNHRLMPGEGRELTVNVNTGAFDGAVDESLILVARREGAEVPLELRVQGFVYTPVSISPKLVEFYSAKKEREKEILVRNNSKSTLELKSLRSNAGNLAIEPLPAKILPGQELRMKVKQIRDVSEPNMAEFLSIDFAEPIEDMAYIGLNVVINAETRKRQQSVDPELSRQIQEIIQKNKLNLPKR